MSRDISVQKEVMLTIIDLIRRKPFYGHILQQMQKIHLSSKSSGGVDMPTIGVGKLPGEIVIKLYIFEDFIKGVWAGAKDEKHAVLMMRSLLEHETLHCVFDHFSLDFSDKLRGAIATDLAVNSFLNKDELPPGQFPDMYKLPFSKSAAWYYAHLENNDEFKKQKKMFGDNFSGCDKGSGSELGDGSGSHGMWKDLAKDPLMRDMIKDIVKKAKESCGGSYGNIPGQIITMIDDMMKRKPWIVPWNKVLRMFAASATESNLDYTMKRISKRFGSRPGTRKEDVLNLAVAIDTSMSISNEQLVVFFNEIQWIHKSGATVTVFEADTKVQRKYLFRGKFNGSVAGRGGTDLEPVLAATERKFDALVYFTDFEAPKIEKRYRIPILWVLTRNMPKEHFPYEWGKVVSIDGDKAIAI